MIGAVAKPDMDGLAHNDDPALTGAFGEWSRVFTDSAMALAKVGAFFTTL
ncbi:hypothetical protein [Sphingobium yanoikuyae]